MGIFTEIHKRRAPHCILYSAKFCGLFSRSISLNNFVFGLSSAKFKILRTFSNVPHHATPILKTVISTRLHIVECTLFSLNNFRGWFVIPQNSEN